MESSAENNKIIQTQVIIIGAGPAGAMSSVFLSKAGIHHIIIEKEIFPRDKICGDACSGKSVFVLKKANPKWLDEIFINKAENLACNGLLFVSPNGKKLSLPFSKTGQPQQHAAGFVTPRLVFDNFLFNKITSPYATIYQKATVKKITRENKAVTVEIEYQGGTRTITSPLIIGADGDKSMVRKTFVNNDMVSKTGCVGLRGYYKNVSGFHENNFIELHFLKELLPGYFWIFPLSNGNANVGVGMLSEVVRAKKINLRELMLHAIQNNPNIRERFANATLVDKIQGWGLPMMNKPIPLSGDHYLLTGDAARLIDPFSGEGIGNALYSGMLAAQAAEALLKENKFSADEIKVKYDDVLYRNIGDELKMGKLLQKLSRQGWLFNLVVNKANKSQTLNTALTSMFSDLDLKKQLRKPSFYAKILFNK
ncbi:MAG: geranylgeranyl reductase family protein [Bacteroidetes bacterium]|nr:geranylgeranyl reductase family protein [Bacteroidota bacterium]MBS1758472.1 geranylgeranyl reductase family protein [Bacteroidota bacterium]